MSESVFVDIIEGSVKVGCTKCQRVIARGNFSLCIIKDQRHYLIGGHSPEICCDHEAWVPLIFSSEQEVERARTNLIAEIKKYNDIAHLSLFPLVRVVSPTLH